MPRLAASLALALLATGCVGSGDVPTTLSGQIVGFDGEYLGPGLVLIENGPVHDGAYQFGALIDEGGRFTVDLSGGGTWGIHIFRDDYSYLPLEVTIDAHQQIVLTSMMVQWGTWMDLTGEPTWPDQPADQTLIAMPWDDNEEDNPDLLDYSIGWDGDYLAITADVEDPQGDLSRMILLHDEVTGGGYAMNPPGPPDSDGNYPNGTYKLTLPRDERHVPGESRLYLVISDNLCNDSDIEIITIPTQD